MTVRIDENINAYLAGTVGITPFPARALAADGVSIAEVLRMAQENLIRGTGTQLPDNQSIYDLLAGANGIAAWAAAAAPGNGVSIAEAIRYIVETQIGTLVNTGGTATIGGILGDLANDSLVARLNDVGSNVDSATTDNLQGKIGTDTELADRSLYDILNGGGPAAAAAAAAPANDVPLYAAVRHIVETLLGAFVNTGAANNTLATIVGDLANDSLVARLNDIGSNVDSATTDNLQGKLGTDTELADRSLYDLINGAGPAASAAAAAPANDVSLYAAVRHIVETLLGAFVNTGAANNTLATVVGDFANDSLVARLNDIGSNPDSAVTSDLQGKIGTDTELADRSLYDILNGAGPAAAAAAAAPDNDVSLYGALRAVYNLSVPNYIAGETDMDEGDYDWTSAYPALLTIATAVALADVVVYFDLAKAVTGFATNYAAQTIQFHVERKVNGALWRRDEAVLAAPLSGTLAAGRLVKVDIGTVGVTEDARIVAVLSAENGGATETEIPYVLYYKGVVAPTITPLVMTV